MTKMPQQREFHPPHIYQDNSCYFLTASVAGRRRLLDTDEKRVLLRDVLKEEIMELDFRLYAWVILANHYHVLLMTNRAVPIHRFVQRLHSKSAVKLNRLDRTPGRTVWYQYWDRFPRNEREFWSYFNYIHINPIKHGYARVVDSAFRVESKTVQIESGHLPDVHECLAQYPHSSYRYYLREYGEGFLTNGWMSYPIPDYLAHDDL
jgi:putative transposase